MFGGHKFFGIRDTMTSRDHMRKGSYDLIGKSPSSLKIHPAKFIGNRSYGSGNVTILIFHVTCDNVIEGYMTLWLGAPIP